MSVTTRVIVQGNVVSDNTREGISSRTQQPYKIREALVVGPLCLAMVTIPNDMSGIALNQAVTLLAEVSTYQDDDQLRALQVLDQPGK